MSGVRSECMSCGRVFSGMRNFDSHRVETRAGGERRCRTDAELQRDAHLIVNEKGWWARPPDPRHADEIARRRLLERLPAPRVSTEIEQAAEAAEVPRASGVFAVRTGPRHRVRRAPRPAGVRRRRIA